MQEMLGQSDAARYSNELWLVAKERMQVNNFTGRSETWVSEVIEGQDGLSVQAHLLIVDGLIEGTPLDPEWATTPPPQMRKETQNLSGDTIM